MKHIVFYSPAAYDRHTAAALRSIRASKGLLSLKQRVIEVTDSHRVLLSRDAQDCPDVPIAVRGCFAPSLRRPRTCVGGEA